MHPRPSQKHSVNPFSLSTVAVLLTILIPTTVIDNVSLDSIAYSNAQSYFLLKLTVYFIAPLCFFTALHAAGNYVRPLFWLILLLLAINIFYFVSKNSVLSFCGAVLLLLNLRYSQRSLHTATPWLAAISLCLLLFVTARFYLYTHAGLTSPDISAHDEDRSLKLDRNTYVLVFDELASSMLIEKDRVNATYRNFHSLSKRGYFLPYATTNYDSTVASIPALLRGSLVETLHELPRLEYLGHESVLDRVAADKLFIWGSALPYCDALRYRRISAARCFDEFRALGELSLLDLLRLEYAQVRHLFFSNFLLEIARVLVETQPDFMATLLDTSVDTLRQRVNTEIMKGFALLDLGEFRLETERHRLADFLQHIGTGTRSLYFYHSRLPHFPYLWNRNLEQSTDFSNSVYGIALNANTEAIDQRYRETLEAADTILGRILQTVRAKDPTAHIIVTSDHGLARHQIGGRGNGLNNSETVYIPLFIVPGEDHALASGARTSSYQHIDLVPTLLELWGMPRYDGIEGVSIFSEFESPFFFRSGQVKFAEAPTIPR